MWNEELADVWRKRLADIAESNLTVRKWCEQQGVSFQQYVYWRRRLAFTDAPKPTGADWLPVAVIEAAPVAVAKSLTVRIAGAAIDLQPGFDPDLLRSVVAALGAERC